jgi:hypothetical protein
MFDHGLPRAAMILADTPAKAGASKSPINASFPTILIAQQFRSALALNSP